jgi:hypothetical protein
VIIVSGNQNRCRYPYLTFLSTSHSNILNLLSSKVSVPSLHVSPYSYTESGKIKRVERQADVPHALAGVGVDDERFDSDLMREAAYFLPHPCYRAVGASHTGQIYHHQMNFKCSCLSLISKYSPVCSRFISMYKIDTVRGMALTRVNINRKSAYKFEIKRNCG